MGDSVYEDSFGDMGHGPGPEDVANGAAALAAGLVREAQALAQAAAALRAATAPSPDGGGDVLFTDAELWLGVDAVTAGMTSWRLELHDAAPDSDLADAATFDLTVADQATYLGSIDLGTPVDKGSTLYVQKSEINLKRALSGSSVFAYLVTVGPFIRSGRTRVLTALTTRLGPSAL